jgi:hypothetical protein
MRSTAKFKSSGYWSCLDALLNLINYLSWWDDLLLNPIKWLLNKWFLEVDYWKNYWTKDCWTEWFLKKITEQMIFLKTYIIKQMITEQKDYWTNDYLT